MATDVIKVFTPIKRVPIMVGKAQNGQKLPFGPYTLPQIITGVVLMVITSAAAMGLPVNPAITFIAGSIVTVVSVFGIGLVPYTGVRITSRIMWIGRLLLSRQPVSASGIPATVESSRNTSFVEESVVVILPDRSIVRKRSRSARRVVAGNILERWSKALPFADSVEQGALIEGGD